MNDRLTEDEEEHLITENRDAYGRSSGFAYSKGGTDARAEQYGYATDGRLGSTAFNHGGEWKTFGYNYLPGTHLLQSLSMPNGITLTQQHEPQRDLLTGMEFNRGETAVVQRYYTYDADGNQTRVQTSTGIWTVAYNAENRPRQFTRSNADGTTTRITCAYDFMGRRATKKVETLTAGTPTTDLHQRYLYRGYLQIACCDLTRDTHPHLWFITWDPTQPVATRPLALRKDGTWYTYGWDLTKNICEVFGADGLIKTTYSYTPFGAVTAEGTAQQPIQWSSEFNDEELGLVYYNARHYNPQEGRWGGRDPILVKEIKNVYIMCFNQIISKIDVLGKAPDINFMDPNEPNLIDNQGRKADYNAYQAGQRYINHPNEFTIYGHGNPISIGGYDAESLFQLMISRGYEKCKDIRLIACETAQGMLPIGLRLQQLAFCYCGDNAKRPKVYAYYYKTAITFNSATGDYTASAVIEPPVASSTAHYVNGKHTVEHKIEIKLIMNNNVVFE